ncbi:hypothetical protein H8L32_15920 [Undibacterium sp. CY18W]|uniref:Uncharacterized protein n=1 Tax=Undibacterium hunanense TaxID=2762292 RepID=A0ABR6ZT03_9BURK|nr:hypothetical protein [Undibacterium hunanense]MBC3918979.1 hypothetical protein [Undibacterium hunanense]
MDANADLIHANKQDPYQATHDFGLSVDEQAVLLMQGRKKFLLSSISPSRASIHSIQQKRRSIWLVAVCVLKKKPSLPDDGFVVFSHCKINVREIVKKMSETTLLASLMGQIQYAALFKVNLLKSL